MTEEADVADPWSAQERRRVSRLCVVLTGDPAAADDLAQETLLQAWRIRDRLVDPAARGPWLDAIARHVCRRWRTRQGRIGVHEVSAELPGEPAGTAHADQDELLDHLEHEELAALLERALSRLPSETRQALVARYVDDLAPAEIGARLGLSPQAVSMRLVRGRSRIRQLLETELVDDPLAQAWVGRHGVAWRATRVPCASCGRPGTSMRRDTRIGAVELRCDSCEPDGVASRWRLDNPALAPHLEAVRRPSAVVSRMADWAHAWWLPAIEAGRVACTRCGSDCPVQPYERSDRIATQIRRGWAVTCRSCGEELTTSFLGLAMSFPETRALRGRRPRARAVPTRRIETDGRGTLVVAVRDDVTGDLVEVLFDDATSRVAGLVVSR